MGDIGTVVTYCHMGVALGQNVTTVPITPIWSQGKVQATTNLLPVPRKVLNVAKTKTK